MDNFDVLDVRLNGNVTRKNLENLAARIRALFPDQEILFTGTSGLPIEFEYWIDIVLGR